MAVDFSDDPSAQGFFAPLRFEANIHDCDVRGEIPAEIRGTFYRTGMDQRFPPRYPNDAPFNADGFVDMFRFIDGHVDFRSRYVRTERFLAERQAHQALYGLYRNKYTSKPSVRDKSMNVANTNLVYHGSKLFVLKESDPPIEMDPHTLKTKGEWHFNGELSSPTFTAHPKVDPVTGEMIAFGYEAGGEATRDVAFFWINADGAITKEVWFKAPHVTMMHDMAVSRDHIIIPTTGFVTSQERLKDGKIHWGFDPNQPTYIGVMPRDGGAEDLKWFKGPGIQLVHLINAVTDGNKITVDAPVSDSSPFPFFPNIDGSPFDPEKAMCTIRRLELDLTAEEDAGWTETVLFPDHVGGGLARMDDRYTTRPHRYSFMGISDPSKPFDQEKAGTMPGRITNCYAKFDHDTGNVETFFAGDTHSLQEAQFVPRSADAPEGDGYLVGVASNYAERQSELVIVDTAAMSDGAVGRVKLPFRCIRRYMAGGCRTRKFRWPERRPFQRIVTTRQARE